MGSRPSEKASINYICERALGARAFFNLEGGNGRSAVITRKGINTFTFTVEGKAGHASRCATEGASAILEAAHKIIACEAFKDADGVTCSCGVISGGTVSNAIPEKCVFKADVRYVTMEQRTAVIRWMEEIAAVSTVPGTRTTVTYGRGRIPMEYTERNVRLLADINVIYEQNGLAPLEGVSSTGGSDAADVTASGIPCLDNLGVCGDRIHSVEEYCLLSSVSASAKRLALAAYYL
jgi:glutamate carboxypeptidase